MILRPPTFETVVAPIERRMGRENKIILLMKQTPIPFLR